MGFYFWYEMAHAALGPARALSDMTKLALKNPINPLAQSAFTKQLLAGTELFERVTRRYGKPEFGLDTTCINGTDIPVRETIVWENPFCKLIHFERLMPKKKQADPKVLIVAPMSGHYATLLRGTVEALLPQHDVYITDWADARMVPLSQGMFNLDDFIDYLIMMQRAIGGQHHIVAVCQPSVPVLAATALMEKEQNSFSPLSMTLMGGPIDTRINPTEVNLLAEEKGLEWFKRNVILTVPFPNPGMMRPVYPGFLQLSGFMSMNLDRHITAHKEFFAHLVEGDGDSAEKHRDFYDEYLAVMDLTAEFYLQTVDTVFVRHSLPKGEMMHRGSLVDCRAIEKCALLTIEGEKDDITGRGQTKAAHTLCKNLSTKKREHYEQKNVGHYGVFNGSRYRNEIMPRMAEFFRKFEPDQQRVSAKKAEAVKPAKGAAKSKAAPSKKAKMQQSTASKSEKVLSPLEKIMLSKPEGRTDDLKKISGIGPKLEQTLNANGLFHYWQIAKLNKKSIEALDELLSFKGRIERESWVAQAKKLTSEGQSV